MYTSPPNTVCVTTLPCKILITSMFISCLFLYTVTKSCSIYFGNNCQLLSKFHKKYFLQSTILDSYYLFTSNR